ncbi:MULTISPECIES: hypothetical protein [unclassified Bradyrhizobium]
MKKAPNIKKKQRDKNCEGKGLLKKDDAGGEVPTCKDTGNRKSRKERTDSDIRQAAAPSNALQIRTISPTARA